jgi:hypothetical protein
MRFLFEQRLFSLMFSACLGLLGRRSKRAEELDAVVKAGWWRKTARWERDVVE